MVEKDHSEQTGKLEKKVRFLEAGGNKITLEQLKKVIAEARAEYDEKQYKRRTTNYFGEYSINNIIID